MAQVKPMDPAPQAQGDGEILSMVAGLKPGEFLWWPQVAPQGPTVIMINRTTQRAILYRNGIPIGISTVSTGKPGHETPTGIFQILQKQVVHFSNLYNNAPMPFMQRLTWGGVALHAGQLPGYPASHGCIRLPVAFARLIFAETSIGMTVVVTDQPALPALVADNGLFGTSPTGTELSGDVVWTPELAPRGPVTIIISAADQRVVVLRDGREIGSAPIAIDAPIERPALYALQASDAAGQRWLRIALPDQPEDSGPPLVQAQFRVSESFRVAVASILTPGATVLLVKDSLVAKPVLPRP